MIASAFEKKKGRRRDGPEIHAGSRLQLELEFELQLDSSWEQEIASTSCSRETVPVNHTEITAKAVRLSARRLAIEQAQISWPIPDMPIEGIEEVDLEEKVTALRNFGSFQQVEVLAQIRGHSIIRHARKRAEGIRASCSQTFTLDFL